ncbi:MAG: NapC/NirT family cytochrome c [Bryobacterales bacterium]|nr:NapC/NirT family cytochrome c [Bryobacterales bacterium]MBV9399437.1 NapC/NirT family cytochrome c [Bryobacterales bacterium]
MPSSLLIGLFAIALVLVLLIGLRPRLTRSREGKILAFVALFIVPAIAAWAGFSMHMDRAQSREFCLSCHVMSDFGKSLYVDDPSYLAARHFQNNRVPRDRACYTCHTDYTLFGGVKSKIRGLRHLQVQYLGTIPKPADIKLYEPYNNRECLHCHLGARRFEESSAHRRDPDLLNTVKAGRRSCLSNGCHDIVHEVGSLKDATFWKSSQ